MSDQKTEAEAGSGYAGPACSTCRFFYCHQSQGESSRMEEDGSVTRTPHVTVYLYCRRFPKHEMREPWDWCGEHQPLPNTSHDRPPVGGTVDGLVRHPIDDVFVTINQEDGK
jgi:hypothetical protein